MDDGSSDDTSALVRRWQTDANFPILYYRYERNRGKNAALNVGRRLVSGEFILELDSDDALLHDALETVVYWCRATGVDALPDVGGLAFRLVDESGRPVGQPASGDRLPQTLRATNREARYRYGMAFDFVRVTKTVPFLDLKGDELTNADHVPPSIYWSRFSRWERIYIDRPIARYYRQDGEARLSDKASPKAVKWPRGNYLRALAILNEDIDWLRHDPKAFLNAARKITRLGLHIGRTPRLQFGDLASARARLLWAAGAPGGLAGYIRDRLRGRRSPQADPDLSAWGPAAPPENPVLYPPPERFRRNATRPGSPPDGGAGQAASLRPG